MTMDQFLRLSDGLLRLPSEPAIPFLAKSPPENSPALQCWGHQRTNNPVPEGRKILPASFRDWVLPKPSFPVPRPWAIFKSQLYPVCQPTGQAPFRLKVGDPPAARQGRDGQKTPVRHPPKCRNDPLTPRKPRRTNGPYSPPADARKPVSMRSNGPSAPWRWGPARLF